MSAKDTPVIEILMIGGGSAGRVHRYKGYPPPRFLRMMPPGDPDEFHFDRKAEDNGPLPIDSYVICPFRFPSISGTFYVGVPEAWGGPADWSEPLRDKIGALAQAFAEKQLAKRHMLRGLKADLLIIDDPMARYPF